MPDKPHGQTNGHTTGHTTGAKSAETKTDEPKAALDTALAQIEIVRGDFRNASASLNKLAEALKQAQRESKASDREIASVRQTLRQIQAVRVSPELASVQKQTTSVDLNLSPSKIYAACFP